jgi:hypothetical protein
MALTVSLAAPEVVLDEDIKYPAFACLRRDEELDRIDQKVCFTKCTRATVSLHTGILCKLLIELGMIPLPVTCLELSRLN